MFLKLEIIKKVIGVLVLLATMNYGVYVMALSLLFTSVLAQIINSWPNKKLLDYSYPAQLKDMLPAIVLSCVMGLCVYPIQLLPLGDLPVLLLQVIAGAGIYIGLSALFKVDTFSYVLSIAEKLLHRKK